MFGPVLGSLLYSALDYSMTFYTFSGIVFLGFIQAFFLLPKRLNNTEKVNSP
jgi:hypothetical protein